MQNNPAATTISYSIIGSNLQDLNNTAPTMVTSNAVHGNLQCQSNTSIAGSNYRETKARAELLDILKRAA